MNLIPKIFRRNNISSKHVINTSNTNLLNSIQEFLMFGGSNLGSTRKFVESFEKNAIVYMIVNKISTNSTALERICVDSKGVEKENSEILNLLENPNTYQGREEFLEKVAEQLLLAGNTFIWNESGIGAGNELHVLEAADTKILIDKLGNLSGYKTVNSNGHTQTFDLDEVLHIKMSNSSKQGRTEKYWGVSPLSSMWTIVKSSNNLFEALAHIWKNRGIIGLLTNKSETPLLPKERDDIQNTFDNDTGGASKSNKISVTTGDMAFVQVGMSPGDLKLLEGNIENLRMIAAGYKMPSVLFNDTASSTYNNVLEAKKEAFTDAYIPLAKKIDNKLSRWLSIRLKVEETIKVDFTMIEVLSSSTNKIANKLNNLPLNVAARIMEAITYDEARDLIGLDGVNGGDLLLGKTTNPKEDGQKEN